MKFTNLNEEKKKQHTQGQASQADQIIACLLANGIQDCSVSYAGGLAGVDRLGNKMDIAKIENDEQFKLLHSIRSNYLVLPAQLMQVDSTPPVLLQTTSSFKNDLDNLLNQAKPLPHQLIYKISLDLVRGLIDLHQHNIAHFDVKPQNIVLGYDNKWKHTNFNVAQQITPSPSSSSTKRLLKGLTVYFSSPEQYNEFYNKNVSQIQQQYQPTGLSSDVYSLGLVFLQMSGKELASSDLEKSKQRPFCFAKIVGQKMLDYNRILIAMLAYNPLERPSLNCIHSQLSALLERSQNSHLYDILQAQQNAKKIFRSSFVGHNPSSSVTLSEQSMNQSYFTKASYYKQKKNGSSLSQGSFSNLSQNYFLQSSSSKFSEKSSIKRNGVAVTEPSINSTKLQDTSGILCQKHGAGCTANNKTTSCMTPLEIYEQSTIDVSKLENNNSTTSKKNNFLNPLPSPTLPLPLRSAHTHCDSKANSINPHTSDSNSSADFSKQSTEKTNINVATDAMDAAMPRMQSSFSSPSEYFSGATNYNSNSLQQRQVLQNSKSKKLVLKRPYWIGSPKASALPPIQAKQYLPSILHSLSPRLVLLSKKQ